MKSFWRAETGIFLGIWLILMAIGRDRFFNDPGTFWHVVVGRDILSTGQFPHTDSFSFTCAGQPWIANQWLGECALALLYDVGGWDTLLLATVTLLAGLYTFVAHRLLRAGLHPLLAVLMMVLAILVSSYHFHVRPHIVTMLFLGWLFAQLCDFEAGRLPLARLFWLVPIFVVWTNVHGGMLGGLGTLAAAVAGWGLAKLIGWPSPLVQYRQLIPLGILVLACGLTAFVNPYGLDMPRSWLAVLGSPVVARSIDEHTPLLDNFWSVGLTVLLFIFFYVVALVGVLPQRPRVTWLLPLLWLALAFKSIRHGPLFAITGAIALAEIFPHVRWAGWLAGKGRTSFRIRKPEDLAKEGSTGSAGRFAFVRPCAVPALLVFSALVFQATGVPVPIIGRDWVEVNTQACPIELLPDLGKFEWQRPGGTPIFNDMLYGGFLIYYTPGFRVFIDDRCELYGDERLVAYIRAMLQDQAPINRWAEEYGFSLALVQSNSYMQRYLQGNPGWVLVRQTAQAALYRRSSP
jgi:hypothetical protein